MSDREFTITLRAKDGTSTVFKAVGQSAKTAAADVSRANQEIAASSEKASQGFTRLRGAGAALGVIFGEISGHLTEVSRRSAENQSIQVRLQQSVEATGQSFAQVSDAMQAASNRALQLSFDDDKATEALATLTQETGGARAALQELGLAEDLARARGIDLTTAAEVIGRVYTGNIGILSRYGISVRQGADAQEALAEVQAKVAGQAAAYADTQAGTLDRLKNEYENLEEAAVGYLGPATTIIALLPGLSEGFSLTSAAVGHLAEVFATEKVAAAEAAVATEAAETANVGLLGTMAGALGLVGVAAGAAVAVGGLILYLHDLDDSAAAAAHATDDVTQAVYGLVKAGAEAGLIAQVKEINQGWTDTVDLIKQANNLSSTLGPPLYGQGVPGMSADEVQHFVDTYALGAEQIKQIDADIAAIEAQIGQPHVNTDQLIATLQELKREVNGGEITAVQYANAIHFITQNFDQLFVAIPPVMLAVDQYARSARVAGQSSEAAANRAEYLRERLHRLAEGYTLASSVAAGFAAGQHDYEADNAQVSAFLDSQRQKVDDLTHAFLQQAGALPTVAAQIAAGLDRMQASAGADRIALFGVITGAEQAQTALAAMTNVVIDGTDAISKQSDKVAKWATDLVGLPGTLGKVDDLLAKGIIDQGEYNAAVTASSNITAANAAIQNDLLKIQTDQLPAMDALTQAYAVHIDQIAHLPAQQQIVALGFMDTTEAAKAQAAVMLAAQAATGGFQAQASEAIVQAAQADPVLRAMLIDMGLIKEGANGEISVVFPESLPDEIHDLAHAIEDLVKALTGVGGPADDATNHLRNLYAVAASGAGGGRIGFVAPELDTGNLVGANRRAPGGGPTGDSTGGPEPNAGPTLQVIPGARIPPAHPTQLASTSAAEGQIAAAFAPIIIPVTINDRPALELANALDNRLRLLAGGNYTAEVEADAGGAYEVIKDAHGRIVALVRGQYVVPIDGDSSAYNLTDAAVHRALDILDGSSATPKVYADNSSALGSIGTAENALAAADGSSATMLIYGDASDVPYEASKYDGAILGTAYVQILPLDKTNYGAFQMLGGVIDPPRAAGGMVVRMNEVGGENVILPNGSMVIPHPATEAANAGMFGGAPSMPPINLTINLGGIHLDGGAQLSGNEDRLALAMMERMAPAIADAVSDVWRGLGHAWAGR